MCNIWKIQRLESAKGDITRPSLVITIPLVNHATRSLHLLWKISGSPDRTRVVIDTNWTLKLSSNDIDDFLLAIGKSSMQSR